MSISPKQKKIKIFNLFSQNLEWIKEHPSIEFKPDFSNGYICPLCFEVFFEKDLDSKLPNYLTIEDVPPSSLGGKPITLTCKECNSRSGHELDNHLLNLLVEHDFRSFLPQAKSKATFTLNNHKVNGIVEFSKEGVMKMEIQNQHSNPEHSKSFAKDFTPQYKIYSPLFHPDKIFETGFQLPTIQMKPLRLANERRAEIALLRIAYLLAYSILGNGILINSDLFKVREQILKPDEEILPNAFWINYEFPKECEGINIILAPKELQAFLVVFNLTTPSTTRQFAIILPGPSSPGIKAYDFFINKLCVGDGTTFYNFTCEHLPNLNYLKEKNLAFASNWFWQEYTKDDYKPLGTSNLE